MYICEDCGKIYENNEVEYNPNEGLNGDYPDVFNTIYVENCDCGGALVEAKECHCCGEWISANGYDYCKDCLEEHKNLDTMLEIGADWENNISLNGFLTSAFTKEDIEQILIDALKNGEKEKLVKAINKYCEEDIEYFWGVAEKKWKEEK